MNLSGRGGPLSLHRHLIANISQTHKPQHTPMYTRSASNNNKRIACTPCRRKKTRCDLKLPCGRCKRLDLNCDERVSSRYKDKSSQSAPLTEPLGNPPAELIGSVEGPRSAVEPHGTVCEVAVGTAYSQQPRSWPTAHDTALTTVCPPLDPQSRLPSITQLLNSRPSSR